MLGLAWPGSAFAQVQPADLVGTYNGSQMEVGTGLRLEADGRFEYFLSYGAMDEAARGTWEATDSGIALTSDPVNAPRFELVGIDAAAGGALDITLEVAEDIPLQLFEAGVRLTDGSGMPAMFDKDRVSFKIKRGGQPVEVMLAFPLYQIASDPVPVPAGTRAMHFRFVPNDLGTVAFDHQILRRDGDSFVLERFDRTLRFRKEQPGDEVEGDPQETEAK
uniref:hypothetical protein n=1 Tax=Altererythrobacter segetis TaxID=1104773 RepID=UPI00140C7C3C|nr:hypothetical protein [Altererythrobacter segetis]